MQFDNIFVPYGGYWSTQFCRWQGSFANLEPIPFAAEVALAEASVLPQEVLAGHAKEIALKKQLFQNQIGAMKGSELKDLAKLGARRLSRDGLGHDCGIASHLAPP